MISNEACKLIQDLDLEPIKFKLMHEASGEGWSEHKASAVEAEYRRFLYLIKTYPNEPVSPGEDVDTFWHYHILDTMKYGADCDAVFGYFVHHYPYAGMGGEDDELAMQANAGRSRALYEATFSCRYPNAGDPGAANDAGVDSTAAYCILASKATYCITASKPSYCIVASKPAYCILSGKPSYCILDNKAAYCIKPDNPASALKSSTSAYCIKSSKPARIQPDAVNRNTAGQFAEVPHELQAA